MRFVPRPPRVPPSARRRKWQSRPRAARRRGCRPGNLCPAGTLSRPTYRPGSRSAAGTHRVEVAVPAGPPKRAGLVDRRGFGGDRSQREVDRLALGLEVVAPHDLGACPIVDIHVGACDTPIIHQEADGAQIRGASQLFRVGGTSAPPDPVMPAFAGMTVGCVGVPEWRVVVIPAPEPESRGGEVELNGAPLMPRTSTRLELWQGLPRRGAAGVPAYPLSPGLNSYGASPGMDSRVRDNDGGGLERGRRG